MLGIKLTNVKNVSLNLYQQGVETRPMFPPISHHPHLSSFQSEEKNSTFLYENCLILPSHPNLDKKQIQYITKLIKNYAKKI
jgi:dTDP-4-amino-4,6-dideoxygalactose transaminase